MATEFVERWYVLRTRSQAESVVASELSKKGHTTFFPTVDSVEPDRGPRRVPLFPGYIFVRETPGSEYWLAIQKMPGVVGWLQLGDDPASLTDEDIDTVSERASLIDREGGLRTRFRKGERVRIVAGNIEALAEIVEEPGTPTDRVRVLIEFLGNHVPAEVRWSDLRRTASEEGRISSANKRRRRTRGKGRFVRGVRPHLSLTA